MVVLYSTGCPRCKVLKAKLEQKGIEYAVNDSEAEMRAMGMTEVPMLDTGTEVLGFSDAVKWVNSQ